MNLLGIIETLRRNLRTVVLGCYVALALVVVLDFVRLFAAHEPEGAAAEHATDFWTEFYHVSESWPAFWAAFGLLGCLILVIVSKTYGHLGISEREDYYHE